MSIYYQEYDANRRIPTQSVAVAASQTTAQVSRAGNAVGDMLHVLAVVPASSAVGAVTVFDGTTAILSIPALAGGDSKPYSLLLDVTATSTKGFNITTGASVSVLAIGRFDH